MKYRFTFLLVALLIKTVAFSQRTIQMEYDNGVYRLPCTVNGANMKMIFDTGASTVCLSLASAIYLYENGFIKSADFKGTGQSSTASGDIVNNMIINLRDIEIGGMHLYNVECVVMESLTSPLLLGQSAIQKLGTITIKGNQLIIYNGSYNSSSQSLSNSSQSVTKSQYFSYNGYQLERNTLIRNLQMEYDDWIRQYNVSSKRRGGIAKYVMEIIEFIRKGQCSYEMNVLHFDTNYGNIKRSQKEFGYLRNAVYYINVIAKQMVKEGEYVK